MKYQEMRKIAPFVPGSYREQIGFDFFGIVVFREPQSICQSPHMGIYRDPLIEAERSGQNDVCCFARHAGQADQFLHGLRHFAVKFVDKYFRGIMNILRLRYEKVNRLDVLGYRFGRGIRKIRGAAISLKKKLRDFVDAGVGRLRG